MSPICSARRGDGAHVVVDYRCQMAVTHGLGLSLKIAIADCCASAMSRHAGVAGDCCAAELQLGLCPVRVSGPGSVVGYRMALRAITRRLMHCSKGAIGNALHFFWSGPIFLLV